MAKERCCGSPGPKSWHWSTSCWTNSQVGGSHVFVLQDAGPLRCSSLTHQAGPYVARSGGIGKNQPRPAESATLGVY